MPSSLPQHRGAYALLAGSLGYQNAIEAASASMVQFGAFLASIAFPLSGMFRASFARSRATPDLSPSEIANIVETTTSVKSITKRC